MERVSGRGSDDEPPDDSDQKVRVKCTADSRVQNLDVRWTKGAIFEFESYDDAERWLEDQNIHVPGRLFLSLAPEHSTPISIDYYVKYSAPDTC